MNLTCRIREAGREIGRFLAISAPVCALAFSAGAVPAKPGAMRYDNGGKTIEVFLHGDENSHYFTGKDGVMLLRGDDGRFRYALPDGTRLRASSMTASDPASRSNDEVSLLASFDRKAPFRILEASAAKSAKRKAVSRNMAKVADESYLNTFPTKGSPRCLAILVQFQDVKFTLENPNALFKDMLNEEGFNRHRATGSAADYFKLKRSVRTSVRCIRTCYAPLQHELLRRKRHDRKRRASLRNGAACGRPSPRPDRLQHL